MNQFLDARNLPCPQPILQAKKMLKIMRAGDILTVWCKDVITLVDFKGFCSVAEYKITEVIQHADYYELKILI